MIASAASVGLLVKADGLYRPGPTDPFAGYEETDPVKKPRRHRLALNVTLDPGLLVRAKEQARRDGVSVSRLIEDLLVSYTDLSVVWTAEDLRRYGLNLRAIDPTAPPTEPQ